MQNNRRHELKTWSYFWMAGTGIRANMAAKKRDLRREQFFIGSTLASEIPISDGFHSESRGCLARASPKRRGSQLHQHS